VAASAVVGRLRVEANFHQKVSLSLLSPPTTTTLQRATAAEKRTTFPSRLASGAVFAGDFHLEAL